MFRVLIKFRHRVGGIFSGRNYSSVSSLQPELEKAFNNQINMEFFASFSYLSMAAYFGRQDISYPGCHKYFLNQVQEEREHADKVICYLLRRGSRVVLQKVEPPATQCWESPLVAFKDALQLESKVTKNIFDTLKLAKEKGDVCSVLFLENELIHGQVEEFDRLSRHIAQLEKIGADEAGIYVFDRYLLKDNK